MTRPVEDASPATRPAGSYRVLFVCTANICRSAYAEVAAQRRSPTTLEFTSAGTHALVGRSLDPLIAAHTTEGVRTEAHRARQLAQEHVLRADLVLAMGVEHRRFILDEWPHLARRAYVIGHVARELTHLPDHVTLETLVDHLWSHRSAELDDTVADPYGRGPQAAESAARTIDAFLDVILRRLEILANRADLP